MRFRHNLSVSLSLGDLGSLIGYGGGYIAVRDSDFETRYCADEVLGLLFLDPTLTENQAEQIMDVIMEQLTMGDLDEPDFSEADFDEEDWF